MSELVLLRPEARGFAPNNPALPVILYRGAFEPSSADLAAAMEALRGPWLATAMAGSSQGRGSTSICRIVIKMSQLHGWRWAMFSPETGSEQHIADLCEIKAGLPFHDGPNERMDQ